MKRRAWLFATLVLPLWSPVIGQPHATTNTAPQVDPACRQAVTGFQPLQLYGLWQVTLWPEDGTDTNPTSEGAVLFERHPDYPDGVRGQLRRSGPGNDLTALVSGDVEAGEFNLDESGDGLRMDAVWTGSLTPAACGREIRGVRLPALNTTEPVLNFILRKTPGWR
jgi:hypothetical protein